MPQQISENATLPLIELAESEVPVIHTDIRNAINSTSRTPKPASLLPSQPSKLLRLALNNLKRVELMPDVYKIDMLLWHSPFPDGLCRVCFAGCTVAMTFGVNTKQNFTPVKFSIPDLTVLYALDTIRSGNVRSFIHNLEIEDPQLLKMRDIDINYHDDPCKFKSEIEQLIDQFELLGW